jgi:hypothetical protein
MTREEAKSTTSMNPAPGTKSPWSLPRHLPETNDVEELRRFANLVWNKFYDLEQQTATVSSAVMSNSSNTSSGGTSNPALNSSALIPAWTKTISPPFAILQCNLDGTLKIDSRGYGYIQKVL